MCVSRNTKNASGDKYTGLSRKNGKICPAVAIPEVNRNYKCHRRLVRNIIDICLEVVIQ
jgi:hypothetical protein